MKQWSNNIECEKSKKQTMLGCARYEKLKQRGYPHWVEITRIYRVDNSVVSGLWSLSRLIWSASCAATWNRINGVEITVPNVPTSSYHVTQHVIIRVLPSTDPNPFPLIFFSRMRVGYIAALFFYYAIRFKKKWIGKRMERVLRRFMNARDE